MTNADKPPIKTRVVIALAFVCGSDRLFGRIPPWGRALIVASGSCSSTTPYLVVLLHSACDVDNADTSVSRFINLVSGRHDERVLTHPLRLKTRTIDTKFLAQIINNG